MAGGLYGLLIGVAFIAMIRSGPQPLLGLVFYGLASLHADFAAIAIWQRTRLHLASAAVGLSAVALTVLGVAHVAGYVFPGIPWPLAVVCVSMSAASVLLMTREARRHPDRWKAWQHFMHDKSVLDIILLRHIPDWSSETPVSRSPRDSG